MFHCWQGEEKDKNKICGQGAWLHSEDDDSLSSQGRADDGAISVQMTGANVILEVRCWWFAVRACEEVAVQDDSVQLKMTYGCVKIV